MIRLSRDDHRVTDAQRGCNPDALSVPYICLIALVAVTVGVGLAWLG